MHDVARNAIFRWKLPKTTSFIQKFHQRYAQLDTLTWRELWGMLPNGLPRGVAGLHILPSAKELDMADAHRVLVDELVATCGRFRTEKPSRKGIHLLNMSFCLEMLMRSDIPPHDAGDVISDLLKTKETAGRKIYRARILPLVEKLNSKTKDRQTRPPQPPFLFADTSQNIVS